MTRRKLDLGEHGAIEAVPLIQVDGKWRRAERSRGATSWRARVYYRGLDGLLGEVSTRARTRSEAEAKAKALVTSRLAGGDIEIQPHTPLVTVAEQWLAHIKRPGSSLSARSIELYEQTYRRYVDAPGSSVRGLTISQANSVPRLRGFLQVIADDPGEGAANTTKVVLSHILRWALENGADAITYNSARQFTTPKRAVPKVSARDRTRSLKSDEQQAVLDYADKLAADEMLDPRSLRTRQATADLIAFMAGTGTRITEARTVRWEHVDLTTGVVRLHGTKSRSSRRRLDLPQWLVTRLRARLDATRAYYVHGAAYPRPSEGEARGDASRRLLAEAESLGTAGFVFASPGLLDVQSEWDKSQAGKSVRRVLDGAGFDWCVGHTFRRTVATKLGESNTPVRRIADVLGHKDANTTIRTYLAQDFDGDKSDLAALL